MPDISPQPGYLQRALVSIAATGSSAVIAGATGLKIRVYRLWVNNSGTANTITIQDGSSTNLTGPIALAAGAVVQFPNDSEPWFVTSLGNGFNISLTAAQQLSGVVYYMPTTL